ncbi:hypothetical protein SHIRM173S_00985 [Streptomyces hirsutus]
MNTLCGIGLDTLIEHRTASGAHLQVRYSPTCGTSWGRIWDTRVGDRIELTAAGPTPLRRDHGRPGRDGVPLHPDDENGSRHSRTGLLPARRSDTAGGVFRGDRPLTCDAGLPCALLPPPYTSSFRANSVAQ